jgi:hypothetical protein
MISFAAGSNPFEAAADGGLKLHGHFNGPNLRLIADQFVAMDSVSEGTTS